MRSLISTALLLAFAGPALAVSNTFTYQGTLTDGGVPANGSYDLQFELLSDIVVVAPVVVEDVLVTDGVFSVELDFGSTIDANDFELEVGVRAGSATGAFTVLSPTTPIRPTPQAQVAGLAGEAVSVSPNAVGSAGIADGSIGSDDVDSAQIQHRVGGACPENEAIRAIHADGTVSCEVAGGGGGSVTSVATGAGLTGGPITESGTIAIASGGVTSDLIQDGTVGAADIDVDDIQRRVSGNCPVGSAIRNIDGEGAVSCTAVGGFAWSLTGNAGTDPATNFIGTIDGQPLVMRGGGGSSMQISSSAGSANLSGGSVANGTGAGFRGVTTLGGGALPLSEPGFSLLRTEANAATGNYSTVIGGLSNRVNGANYGTIVGGFVNTVSGPGAAIAGGLENVATGSASTVAGGERNMSAGDRSIVAGGFSNAAQGSLAATIGGNNNCAGGNASFAAGLGAHVRLASGASGSQGCAGVATTADANGDEGSFVWADATTSSGFVTTGPNQFLVRADGGMMLNTNASISGGDDLVVGARLVSGDADADLRLRTRSGRNVLLYASDSLGGLRINMSTLPAGNDRITVSGGAGGNATLSNGGTWTNASSRTFKTAIEPVDARDVLERLVDLDISRWNYIGSGEGTHMGPMAEDFKAAFNLAGDGKSIATVDADGVALAAIQGLNAKLERENAELRARLEMIEARLGTQATR
jgi:hypothetical protein